MTRPVLVPISVTVDSDDETPVAVSIDCSSGKAVIRQPDADDLAKLQIAKDAAARSAAKQAAEAAARNELLTKIQTAAAKSPDLAALISFLGIPLTGPLPGSSPAGGATK